MGNGLITARSLSALAIVFCLVLMLIFFEELEQRVHGDVTRVAKEVEATEPSATEATQVVNLASGSVGLRSPPASQNRHPPLPAPTPRIDPAAHLMPSPSSSPAAAAPLSGFTGQRAAYLWTGLCVDASTNLFCDCAAAFPNATYGSCLQSCEDLAQCTAFAFHPEGYCRIYRGQPVRWTSSHATWSQYTCYSMRGTGEAIGRGNASLPASHSAATAALNGLMQDLERHDRQASAAFLSSLPPRPANGWEGLRYPNESEFFSLGRMPSPPPPMNVE
ncbi:hypothetical protein CYMTET_23707, partial [Cymbomonas tetramitiformis]